MYFGNPLTGWIHGSFYISMDPCASSAGVEHIFSAAGKMRGDLSKSAKDTTLEHSLFAAFHTDGHRCLSLVIPAL